MDLSDRTLSEILRPEQLVYLREHTNDRSYAAGIIRDAVEDKLEDLAGRTDYDEV